MEKKKYQTNIYQGTPEQYIKWLKTIPKPVKDKDYLKNLIQHVKEEKSIFILGHNSLLVCKNNTIRFIQVRDKGSISEGWKKRKSTPNEEKLYVRMLKAKELLER